MYADSLVIAQRNLIEGCARKLVELMLEVQYQVLLDSRFIKVKAKASEEYILMPTLSRVLVKRSPYYGMICSDMQQSIDNIFSNFSLVGGSAIVEMNRLSKVYLLGRTLTRLLSRKQGMKGKD